MTYTPTFLPGQAPSPKVPASILTEFDYGEGYLDTLRELSSGTAPFPWSGFPGRGPLVDAIEWIERCNPRSLRLAALGAALVGLGGACARRVYVQWSSSAAARPSPIQQPVIVVARTGAGKDAPLRACASMLKRAGLDCLPGLPFHMNRLYALLVKSGGALGLALDEVDSTLASLHGRTEHASAKEGALKSMLSCAAHLEAPVVGARNAERAAIEEQLGDGAWTRGVSRPALALLGVSTGNVWDRLAGNVSGGLVGRMLVLDARGPLADIQEVDGDTDDMPESVGSWIDWLNPSSLESTFNLVSGDERIDGARVIRPTDEAIAAASYASWELTEASNRAHSSGQHDLADILARSVESVQRIAAVVALSSVACIDDARIGASHVLWAHTVVKWASMNAASETTQRGEQTDITRAVRVIRERLARPNVVKGVETPWHYKVRVFRGIESTAPLALKAMMASGEVDEDGKRIALARGDGFQLK